MVAERAQQERDFPWQRGDDPRRAAHARRERESNLLERRPLRPGSHEDPATSAELHVGLPGLPQLLRDAAHAIKDAESRVQAAEDQMQEVVVAAEQRVRAAEMRAKAAEDLARSMEKRALEEIKVAERRAEAAEAQARAAEADVRAAEEWVARVRRALNDAA